MTTTRIIKLGERPAGARNCHADPATGRCSCGWTAITDYRTAETMDHLYGDLSPRVREFAYRSTW